MERLNMDILNDGFVNKDVAFTFEERKNLKLEGLLPAMMPSNCPEKNCVEFQYNLAWERFNRISDSFDRYDWIMQLGDRQKLVFYLLLSRHPNEVMPVVYTPTVGAACQELSLVYHSGRGLFINFEHKGRIRSILDNWPAHEIKAICVTDGERILGLGDLGAFGMGIPVGKLALYTALAGISPSSLLPITLDLGTNNAKLLEKSQYFGLRRRRVEGNDYDEFVEEFMRACVDKYGKKLLIQFEDFANHNAFRLLKKYAPQYCTFNDDIQGTASVVLAALLGTELISGRKLTEEIIVCFGAGEAALGLAELATRAMELRHGLTADQAKKNIYMVDSKGLIVHDRSTGGLTEAKLEFARPKGTKENTNLLDIVREVKATCLIGASAVPNSFNSELLLAMTENCQNPVVMALSNPTSKAECTAAEAYNYTNGKVIFASGSPFAEHQLSNGEKRRPAQANNAYVFPGIALGIIVGEIFPVTNDDFLVAAETVSTMADAEELKFGCVLPSFDRIRSVSHAIAMKVILEAKKQNRCKLQFGNESALEIAIKKASQYPFDYSV